jgi:hypothetical protein
VRRFKSDREDDSDMRILTTRARITSPERQWIWLLSVCLHFLNELECSQFKGNSYRFLNGQWDPTTSLSNNSLPNWPW